MIVVLAVARERSFMLAAAELGMTQSVLSHIILRLETRLGVCLLVRTIGSVSADSAIKPTPWDQAVSRASVVLPTWAGSIRSSNTDCKS